MKRSAAHDGRARGGDTRARGKAAAAAAEEAWGIEPIFGLFRKESGKRDGGVGRNFRRCPPESAVGSSLCYGRNNVTLRRELVELTTRLFTGIVKTRTKVR